MAFSNQYALKVDIKRRLSSVVPTFKQGDNGVLKFQIFDDGKKYDLTDYTYSEITFRLPSGQSVIGNPILDVDGVLIYNFTGVEMSEIGKIETILSIYSASTMVSVQPFTCFIYDSMKGEDLSYIGILQDLIAEVQLLRTEVTEVVNSANEALHTTTELKDELDILIPNLEAKEQARDLNENNRQTSESTRIANEVTRKNSEIIRQQSETKRETSEQSRVSAEQTRAFSFNNTIQSATNKIAEMTSIIDELDFKGEYKSTEIYEPYNVVRLNKSSYVALQHIQGIPPNDDGINWRIIALGGIDGSGAVSTVNNKSPALNGNVEVEIADIIGLQTKLDEKATKSNLSTVDNKINNHLADNAHIKISDNAPSEIMVGNLWFDLGETNESEGGEGTFIFGNGILSDGEPGDTNAIWLDYDE